MLIQPARWSSKTMRAARATGVRGPIEVVDMPVPEIEDDDALIRVVASGICRTDWHIWNGDFSWNGIPFPPNGIFGHEIGGYIEAVGKNVLSLRPGQRVTVPWNFACGRCSHCHRGFQNRCDSGIAPQHLPGSGGWAQYMRVPNADLNCVATPEGVDELTTAALGCRYMTAWRSIHAQASIRGGETAVIVGCGGVGLAAIEIANCLGADVIGVDVDPGKLEMARKVGARAVVNGSGLSPEQVGEAVKKLTPNDAGTDVAVDALGISATVNSALYSLKKGGRLAQVGLTSQEEKGKVLVPLDMIVLKELQISGSLGNPHWSFEPLLTLVAQGRLNPQRLVTREVKLSDAESVIREMDTFSTSGYVIITSFD